MAAKLRSACPYDMAVMIFAAESTRPVPKGPTCRVRIAWYFDRLRHDGVRTIANGVRSRRRWLGTAPGRNEREGSPCQ